ncbi:MAG: hypothetical protein ACJAR3_002264 [Roseivirga sp.]
MKPTSEKGWVFFVENEYKLHFHFVFKTEFVYLVLKIMILTMMKRVLMILIFLNTFISNSFAQIDTYKFGEIDISDLEMNVYSLDSGASAIYLVDQATVSFNERDLAMYMKHQVRIKILKEDGLNWANVELNYYKGDSDIAQLNAATHNLVNGKLQTTEIGKRDWITEKINDKYYSKKLSFPDVKVGSIIEYSYEKKSGDFIRLPAWVFQTSIPVKHSEYIIDIPQYGDYKVNLKGYIRPEKFEKEKRQYQIIMKDVPSLKSEPFVASMENFRSKIEFEIKTISVPGYPSEVYMESWEAINRDLLKEEDFGKAIENKSQIKKIYPDDKNWDNNLESLKEIYAFVRDHYKWNEYQGLYMTDKPKQTWDEGEATATEINLTLLMLLRNAGIKVDPVILSTRAHGYINPLLPLIKQFNYTIAAATIDGKIYLLDATNKFSPYDVLPSKCINGEGLMITADGPVWIDLNSNSELDSELISSTIKINEDDLIEGQMSVSYRGIASVRIKNRVFEMEEKEKNKYFDGFDGEIEDLTFKHLEEADVNAEAEYTFTNDSKINFLGDKIFLNPIMVKYIKENPFKLESRLYPIEFSAPVSNTYVYTIEIPEGYEVEEYPQSINMLLPNAGGKYTYFSAVEEGRLQILIKLSLMKMQYLPDDYPALKELYNQIMVKQEQQIVFKKKVN